MRLQKSKFLFTLFVLLAQFSFGQVQADTIEINTKKIIADSNNYRRLNSRKILTGSLSVASLGATFIFLNNAWYKDYERVPLHSFNDLKEWQQMDKMGHVWTAYTGASQLFNTWRWAGSNKAQSMLFGSLTSLGYLATIEYLDGRSAAWGWSWSDMAANFIGTGTFVVQQSIVDGQFLRVKFSAHGDNYDGTLKPRARELFGSGLGNRLLKDYNAQTYWLSVNLRSFFPESNIPTWFNVAVGAGAEGMLGGFDNKAYDEDGNLVFDRSDIPRYRQWYLSVDIDLSRIKTKSKALRTVLNVVNTIKLPLPAIELSKGTLKGHAIYF